MSGDNSNEDLVRANQCCWKCHRFGATLQCSTCARVFHEDCISDDLVEGRCSQCIKIEDARKSCEIPKEKLNLMLKMLYDKLLFDDEYKSLRKAQKTGQFDFNSLGKNIGNYETTADFLADILWIVHYCLIVDPSAKTKRIANELVLFTQNETALIDICNECYVNANKNRKWFSAICARRHTIVWAKAFTYPYIPAKVMRVEANVVDVLFFGDHKTARVQSKHCLSFSKKSPNKNIKTPAKVMEEVNEYIINMKTFKYADFGQKFDPETLRDEPSSVPITDHSQEIVDFTEILKRRDKKFEKEIEIIKNDNSKKIEELENKLTSQKRQYEDELQKSVHETKNKAKEIEELKYKLTSQKRKYEEDLQKSVHETKKKEWCIQCTKETPSLVHIFCSNSCGGKWYQETKD